MTIRIQQHTIHYQRYGKGSSLLFCLHGYGERGGDFEALASALGERFTVICPDLPLHGQTHWTAPSFELPDLHLMFSEIASTEGLMFKPFGLAGYSMGGRLALAYAAQYPEQIRAVVLIAADGLKQNPWYWLSTQTRMGNRLFRATMQSPRLLLIGMKLAKTLGLLNESIFKFAHKYLDDPMQRQALYQRWTLFRHFRPNLKALPKQLATKEIQCVLFFGKFDRIIPPKLARKWRSPAPLFSKVLILEAGHRLLKAGPAEKIAAEMQIAMPA
jgi:pimeloyl-ACP methyl ester carboxylesterase